MKQIGTILLLVVFTLSLTACSTTEIWVDDGMYITYRDIHFSVLEEYEEQLQKEGELPAFITYDMLREIGEFKSFVCLSAASFAESQNYCYFLIDDCDYELMLSIYNRPKKEVIIKELPKTKNVANESDLRTSGKQGSCRFELGAITYRYAKDGRLSTIRWVTQTHIILLTVSDSSKDFADYDLEADTFVSKLLNAHTAKKTVKEFNKSIRDSLPKKYGWNQCCVYWLPWILVAVVSCATIGTVYLILRRKKKKKTAPAE